MNLDPFNEFGYLAKRQERQFQYLSEVRSQIDERIPDSDIVALYDLGIDAVAYIEEKLKGK